MTDLALNREQVKCERMLAGVLTDFGKDSPEYEAAGGTRKSERKRSGPKAKKAKAAKE